MPPPCCRCNGSGRCVNCVCKKSRNQCTNCLPGRKNQCANRKDEPDANTITDPIESSHTPDSPESLDLAPPLPRLPDIAPPSPNPSIPVGQSPEPSGRDPSVPDPPCPDFPSPEPMGPANFVWGSLDGKTFSKQIDEAYEVIVHWKRNLFKVPRGRPGTQFVRELTRLLESYSSATALECVACHGPPCTVAPEATS